MILSDPYQAQGLAYERIKGAIRADAGKYVGLCESPDDRTAPLPSIPEALTGRELQVLRLLAAGLTAREVADLFIISFTTARSYIRAIDRKLDVHSRDEASAKAEDLKLL